MAHRIVPDPLELQEIHAATCRALRQGLICSTCRELADLAARALSATALTEAA